MSSRVGETVSAGEQGAKLQDFVAYSSQRCRRGGFGKRARFKMESFIEFGAVRCAKRKACSTDEPNNFLCAPL